MNLLIKGPRVLVRPEPLPERGTSDLFLSERQGAAVFGTVVALGDGPTFVREAVENAASDLVDPWLLSQILTNLRDEHLVGVGDRVLFAPGAGQWLWFEREEVILLLEDDLLAVVEDDQADRLVVDQAFQTEIQHWNSAYTEVTHGRE